MAVKKTKNLCILRWRKEHKVLYVNRNDVAKGGGALVDHVYILQGTVHSVQVFNNHLMFYKSLEIILHRIILSSFWDFFHCLVLFPKKGSVWHAGIRKLDKRHQYSRIHIWLFSEQQSQTLCRFSLAVCLCFFFFYFHILLGWNDRELLYKYDFQYIVTFCFSSMVFL